MRKITITAILVSLITVVAVYAQTGLNNTEDSVQLAKWETLAEQGDTAAMLRLLEFYDENARQEIVRERASIDKYRGIHLHLNTNGLLSSSQEMMRHTRWNSISMSLHHYNRSILSEIYGTQIPDGAFAFEGVNMDIVNASCNLIRGYIDNNVEVEKMLRFAISLSLPRLGFVALMKVNDYCSEHYVDFDEIDFTTIPHLYFTESRNRGIDCKCSNYLYNHDGKILEVYMRNYANPNYCESSLLFDGQYLRQGFHDDNIIY